MELSTSELKILQHICLELVEEVDRICRKNAIEYTLDGGTLLGAIREHGFIPWDDDADIAMTRGEYEKFFNACKNELNAEKYFLQEYRTDNQYPWGYSKLRMQGTHLVQKGQEHMKFHDGIFIDIFVYDPVPDNIFMRKIHHLFCFFIRKCQYATVGRISSNNPIYRMMYKLLAQIPLSTTFHNLNKLIDYTSQLDSKLASHKTFPYPRIECKYGLPRKCFESYFDVEFENKLFRCIKQYDEYLSLLYGDYMTPTPVSDRKQYPINSIDFGQYDL